MFIELCLLYSPNKNYNLYRKDYSVTIYDKTLLIYLFGAKHVDQNHGIFLFKIPAKVILLIRIYLKVSENADVTHKKAFLD